MTDPHPRTDQWFKYTVSLTHEKSGETVQFTDDWGYGGYKREENWEYDPVFIWNEGNYSCNCNRFLFFQRALGKTEDEIKAVDPSPEDAIGGCHLYDHYVLNWIRNEETGRMIYVGSVSAVF